MAVAVVLAGCSSAPLNHAHATRTSATTNTQDTRLGRAAGAAVAQHPGLSGLHLIEHGVDAFVARLALAEAAERSLDVQYYIWHGDDTGKLLAGSLLRAADRGVRVRVLLDDIGTAPSDRNLLALDRHPNLEVRLFNPVSARKARGLGTLVEYSRVNRRMHNKSFTADNQATIVGGRNVGDEYFSAGSEVEFSDLDVLAVGPVVGEVSRSFDLYWNSPSSLPITTVSREPVTAESLDRGRAALEAHALSRTNSPHLRALRDSPLAEEIRGGELQFDWGRAWVVSDHPDKISAEPGDAATHLMPHLRATADGTQRELLVVSPYFVPGKSGMAYFEALRRRGVRVVILTNSLGSTDVAAVHAGYRRYRKALLRAGVELYEVKASAQSREQRERAKQSKGGFGGSSRASLHAKSFVFDRQTVFVGSLNLDPRSVRLNTEIGVVFESPELAARLATGLEGELGQVAYRLEAVPPPGGCTECVGLRWVTQENGQTVRLTSEPDAGLGRRLTVVLLSLLPIEEQL